jgi:hypothetical protein
MAFSDGANSDWELDRGTTETVREGLHCVGNPHRGARINLPCMQVVAKPLEELSRVRRRVRGCPCPASHRRHLHREHDLYDVSQRDDAQVLQLQYPGYQIFDNSGTVPILVSHLELYWPGGSTTVIVGQQLAPKQMYYKADDLDKLRSSYPSAALVANASGDGTALLPKASAFPYTEKCYSLVFFSVGTPEMVELQRFFAPAKSNWRR